MNDRQWATFVAQAGIQADGKVKTFTPEWTGFSADPTGDLSYMDFGAIVMVWSTTSLLGTSDQAFMSIENLPESIWPITGSSAMCIVINNSEFAGRLGRVGISNGGILTFQLSDTSITPNEVAFSSSFATSNLKGLPSGWLVSYMRN